MATKKFYTITPVVFIALTVHSLPLHQQIQLKVEIPETFERLARQDQVRVAHEARRARPGFQDV